MSKLSREGSHLGGKVATSWAVLKADENIQKKGKIISTAPNVRKK